MKSAIENRDLDVLAEILNTAHVGAVVRGRHTDQERIEIDGWGAIFWDEDSDPKNPGWVTRSYTHNVDEPCDADELQHEMEILMRDSRRAAEGRL